MCLHGGAYIAPESGVWGLDSFRRFWCDVRCPVRALCVPCACPVRALCPVPVPPPAPSRGPTPNPRFF